MQCLLKCAKLSTAFVLAVFAFPSLTPAQHYTQKNLVSDISQPDNADGSKVLVDPNLKNPWGLTRSAGSPWWVGNNNSGTSTLYNGAGVPQNFFPDPHPDSNGNGINSPFNNFVMVPPPAFVPGTQSAPTGVVVNGSPTDFLLAPATAGQPAKQAIFIFSTEDGTISGWNPGVDVTNAIRKVDNSDKGSKNSAVYKGLTSGEIDGKRFLYVTNFRSARVEVYDTNFHRVHLGDDAFDDDTIPRDFAPFNVQNIGGSLFVTYARQDAARHDPVLGDGGGFVDIFSTEGKLQGRLETGWFNAPWGVVWTPRDFGEFSNTILVGNFRSGWIAAFNGFTKKFIGFMKNDKDGKLVFIDGLWSLTFGNNGGAGSSTTLFFTAGPNLEQNGLFGTLTPVVAEQDGDEE
jgi:uncharacterized protein (TIGR03118 family)